MNKDLTAINWTVFILNILGASLMAEIYVKGSYIGGVNLFIIVWVMIYTAITIFIFIQLITQVLKQ